MIELTVDAKTGGKRVKGAHVVISTAHMSRSIADVYACRKDYYDNRAWIDKFTAGYLKACEELVAAKKTSAGRPARTRPC